MSMSPKSLKTFLLRPRNLLVAAILLLYLLLTMRLDGGATPRPAPPTLTLTPVEKKSLSAVRPICDHIESSGPATVNLFDYTKFEKEWKALSSSPSKYADFCGDLKYAQLRVDVRHNPKKRECEHIPGLRDSACNSFHMCLWDPADDEFISARIAYGGIWETKNTWHMIDALKTRPEGGIVIDAGANVGQYTMISALMNFTTFAFEPIQEHVEMIARSLIMNGLQDRVYLYQNALSDYAGSTFINFHKTNKGGSTIEKIKPSGGSDASLTPSVVDERFYKKRKIDLILLDDILPTMLKSRSPVLEYWKADIEGYEPRMYRGAWRTFSTLSPPHLAFEILGKAFPLTKCHCHHLLAGLHSLGYYIEIQGHKEDPFLTPDRVQSECAEIVEKKRHYDVYGYRDAQLFNRRRKEFDGKKVQ